MKPSEIRGIKRRIVATIAKELDGLIRRGEFSKYSKSPDYRMYGKSNFIKDASIGVRKKKKKK